MLIPIDEALARVLTLLPEPEPSTSELARAAGCHLCQDVIADRDQPPVNRSAMDGYAVMASDLARTPTDLRLTGEVAAGSQAAPEVTAGCCVKIFTGANVPPGADAVAIVETTEVVGEGLIGFSESVGPGANIRVRGEDTRAGATIIEKGTRLGPAQIASCASVGADPAPVFALPSVSVMSTGAELLPASQSVRDHQVRNSNGPAVAASLRSLGIQKVTDLGGCPDVIEPTRDAIVSALADHDVIVVTGGVSKGDYDLVPAAIEAAGGTIHLHRVSMKPGKPFLFATLDGSKPVFGLPGNPLSVLVSFWQFVAPALRAMMGDPSASVTSIAARLTAAITVTGDRDLLAPVRLGADPAGGVVLATPVHNVSSADLAAGGRANGVVRLPASSGLHPEGEVVVSHPWGWTW